MSSNSSSSSMTPVDDDYCTQQQEAHAALTASATPLARTSFALPLGISASNSESCFDARKSPIATNESHVPETNQQLQLQIEKLKEALQVMRVERDAEISFLREQLATGRSPTAPPVVPRLVPWMHSITERGDIQTGRLGRHASLASVRALADLQTLQQQQSARPGVALAERMAAAFLNPVLSLPYLHSIQFGADLVELSAHVGALFESEARCLTLTSPVYVLGDVHGNWTDLSFFAQHLWRFGLGLTAGTFLFLGDYVDRGTSSLECVAYLFAQKLLFPHKLFLLRGNHETRAVNGLEHYYGSACFLSQCRARFGRDEGYIVWHQLNHAFDRLPVAATIDDRVFCVHGGIPRSFPGSSDSRLALIRNLPTTAPMDVLDKKFYDANPALRMVSDMVWGDPAKEEHEAALDPVTGFGKSVQRGGSAVSYGTKAVSDFVEAHGFSHIVRAHEAHLDGVAVAKQAKVITVFSTSKDHALGDDATCGCLLVDRDRIAGINRSALGQQNAVRRRRSVTNLQSPPGSAVPSMPSPGRLVTPPRRDDDDDSVASPPSPITAAAAAASSTTMLRIVSPPTTTMTRRRRHRQGQSDNDSDSTDDEAPTSSSTSSTTTSTPSTAAPMTRPRQQRADNNQSED